MTLTPNDLTGLQEYLERGIEGGEVVEYSIFSNSSIQEGHGSELTIGYQNNIIHAYNHESHHKSFIRSVFERLDPLLDIDFVEADSTGNSDINIHRSWYNSYYDEIDLLNNKPSDGSGSGTAHFDSDHIDISWKDYYENDPFTDSEKLTIVHEIGHAMGLIDLGYNPKWNSYDSIMSYNHPQGIDLNTWFTDADIKAMQSIWGTESNDSPSLTDNGSSLTKGTEDTPYTFSESTLLQGFTDIDSTSLSVSSTRSSIGSLSDNGNGTFTLVPPKDFSGTIELSYDVIDGDGGLISASNSVYFNDVPDGIVSKGTYAKDKLKGSTGDDTLIGLGGSDKITGKKGNDIIDAGLHGERVDWVKGGSGSDTFVIKEGYWTNIKDFNVMEDTLNLKGLKNGLDWDYEGGRTYIWGQDGHEVARFSGYKNLDNANII